MKMEGSKAAKVQTLVSCSPLNSLSFRILKPVDVPLFYIDMGKSDIMATYVEVVCCINNVKSLKILGKKNNII